MARLTEEAKHNKTVVEANVTDTQTIDSILRLFRFVPVIVQTVFDNNLSFTQAAKDAFTTIVNKDMGKFSIMQMLAAYLDNLLKVWILNYKTNLLLYLHVLSALNSKTHTYNGN